MPDTPSPPSWRSEAPLTAEAISSGYDSSIVVRRWLGAWVDLVVLLLFFILPDGILGNALYQRTLPFWILLALAYFPLTEGLKGWSLGKLVSKTRVVNAQGAVPGLLSAFLRTLPRILEVNPLLAGGVPAGLIVLASKKRQRLGDMLAGTFVLKKEDLQRLRKSGPA